MPENDKEDLFGIVPETGWTKEDPYSPSQYMTDPSQYKQTEDEYANELAKEWVGQMTRIGPDFYLDDSTASLLSAMKVLGLPLNSKEEILNIATLFIDDSVLLDHVGWLNDQEWAKLVMWLKKLPSRVSFISLCMNDLHG